MATSCSFDGYPLKLEYEHYDEIDRVWVGRLRCPRCKRTWFDQRRPGQVRPAQLELPFEEASA